MIYHLAGPHMLWGPEASPYQRFVGAMYSSLYLLNVFWFYKIVVGLRKAIAK